jgi:uncharacterized RDD family membrane protein YckC
MIYDLQKASMGKRISAALFDIIILACGVVALATIFSAIFRYDSYNERLLAIYDKYEKEFNVDWDITVEELEKLTEDELARYRAANEAINADDEAVYVYNMIFNLTMLVISLSILFGYIILEFIVPNLLGNGQTIGKKIFGIAVMRVDGVKVVPALMFIRTVLGKFTIETMIPVLLIIMILFDAIGMMGTIIIGLILLLQIILMIATKTNSTIHDILAKTVVVDLSSQMIFDSEEAMIDYKTKLHAEQIKN